MMEKNRLDDILKKNPKIDRVAVDRSQQAAKQLADVGIKLGGYRLEPALGGGDDQEFRPNATGKQWRVARRPS